MSAEGGEICEKRRRTGNYSSGERDLLVELVGKYGLIIENKKTDAVTWKEKQEAWQQVANEYNALVSTARDHRQLKQVGPMMNVCQVRARNTASTHNWLKIISAVPLPLPFTPPASRSVIPFHSNHYMVIMQLIGCVQTLPRTAPKFVRHWCGINYI